MSTKVDKNFIKIQNNKSLMEKLVKELIVEPREKAINWSKITNQTPSLKIGYPGQHLASLITGVKGTGTGARGDDLEDGTEVKSCSRIDQLDKCIDCKGNVLRTQNKCPQCGSINIKRVNDSKWLFTIKEQKDIDILLGVPRILLLIGDYPNFSESDYSELRFQSFEIWPHVERHQKVNEIMKNYLRDIYAKNKAAGKETPAPKNFWPYSYQFYLCNPLKTSEIRISSAGKISITFYISPDADRDKIDSEIMPTALLNPDELSILKENKFDISEGITEEMRALLPLRPDRTATQKTPYLRKSARKTNI